MATATQIEARPGNIVMWVSSSLEETRRDRFGVRTIVVGGVPFSTPGAKIDFGVGKVLDPNAESKLGFPVTRIQVLQETNPFVKPGETFDIHGGFTGFVDRKMRDELGKAGFAIRPVVNRMGITMNGSGGTKFELVRTKFR